MPPTKTTSCPCSQMFEYILYNIMSTLKILTPLLLLCAAHSLYSPYYRRCRVHHDRLDADAVPLQNLQVERIATYYSDSPPPPQLNLELEINYQNFDYYYIEYIDAGGSGQVYLVQDEHTGKGKIVKRYFIQKPQEFQRQNYIMHKLNYPIQWAKDCGDHKCDPNATQFSTLSIFPQKESIVLRKLEFDHQQAPLIFYKLLKELQKTHQAGIIHNDIKMGNILVNSIGPHFKFYEVELIDWNLASFYYEGVDIGNKRGTVCYYSPEQLFLTYHITPAIDIWALGVVMYIYYFDRKPFVGVNCKNHNLKAIATLVGAQKLLNMYKKYRFNNIAMLNLLDQLQNDPGKYPQRFLKDIKPQSGQEYYTSDIIEVFERMLEPDPQLRATPEQLMRMPYFKKIKLLPKMYSMKEGKKKKSEQKQPLNPASDKTAPDT